MADNKTGQVGMRVAARIQNALHDTGAQVTFVSVVDADGDVETALLQVDEAPRPEALAKLAGALHRCAEYLDGLAANAPSDEHD